MLTYARFKMTARLTDIAGITACTYEFLNNRASGDQQGWDLSQRTYFYFEEENTNFKFKSLHSLLDNERIFLLVTLENGPTYGSLKYNVVGVLHPI